MTGSELATLRKAAGLSQVKLARQAGIGRHAVSYWECKAHIPHRWRWPWAVEQIGKVLRLPDYHAPNARARARGVRPFAELDAMVERQLAQARTLAAQREARRRVICGAKTRKGTHCQNLSERGKRRCKFHGGKSTGARSLEGRERIAEAQRRRWRLAKAKPPNAADSNTPAAGSGTGVTVTR